MVSIAEGMLKLKQRHFTLRKQHCSLIHLVQSKVADTETVCATGGCCCCSQADKQEGRKIHFLIPKGKTVSPSCLLLDGAQLTADQQPGV